MLLVLFVWLHAEDAVSQISHSWNAVDQIWFIADVGLCAVDPGMQRQGYINLDAGDTAYLVLLKDEPDTSNVNVDGFVWVSPVP